MPKPILNPGPDRPTVRVIRREAASLHHGILVLTLAEEGVYYRQKGRKKAFLIPHGYAFQRAIDLHNDREKDERDASRKGRKGRKARRRR